MSLSTTEPSALLRDAVDLAEQAGELLESYYGKLRRADAARKQGRRRDLVSQADHEAESLVFAQIPESDDVLAEEGSVRSNGAVRCWIVDPLDGTVNYLHGIPFWAVSIGVVDEGSLVAAVVHAPVLGQTFTAERGRGCKLNGGIVTVSRTTELAESIVATGFAYNRNEVLDNNLDNWTTLALASAGVRRMGAASLDLAYTACGRLDGYWELHLSPWDVAAGTLLVREAGGRVTDFSGDEGNDAVVHGANIVASNGSIHGDICGLLSPLKGF